MSESAPILDGTNEEQTQLRAQEEAELLSGYTADPVETPQPAEPTTELQADSATDEDSSSAETQEAEAPSQPDTVTISRTDWERVLSKVEGIDQRFGTAFGKMGEIEGKVKTLQTSRKPVQLTDEDFAELQQEFPEVAELSKKGFARLLAKMQGAQEPLPDQSVPILTPEQVKADMARLLEEERARMQAERQRESIQAMDVIREDWREIVGNSDDTGGTPSTPYRRWLATKPAEYQERIAKTWAPEVIERSIQLFEKETKPKPKPKPLAVDPQRARWAQAVTPKGAGPVGKAPLTEEEEMMQGYAGK